MEIAHPPAQIGQDVLVRAAVYQSASGRGVSLGTMAFAADGATLPGCEAVWVYESSGAAECYTNFAALGPHELKATYSGTSTYAASEATATIEVGKLDPSTYLAFMPPHPVYGSGLIVNALVLGAKGMPDPTGTFTFLEGGKELVTRPIGPDGRALLDVPLAVGTHRLAAVYNGDDYYLGKPEVWIDITVEKGQPTVAISSTPAQLGQPVTITASVLPAGSGGTVTFTGVPGCAAIPVKNNVANCASTFRQLGTVSVAADYSGDSNLTAGSASMKLTVGRLVAGVYAAVFPAAPVYGQAVVIGAQVLGAQGAAPPTGVVTFSDAMGGGTLSVLDGTGHAQWTTAPAAGLRTFTATYNGDANYATSQSVASVMVAKSGTATALTAPTGGPLTATVTAVAPGGGTPTGSVRFVRDGVTLGSAALTGSVATLALAVTTGNVRAEYGGDFNFWPSVSATTSVSAPAVGLKLAADRNPAPAGKVTFTVTGAPNAGTVAVTIDGAVAGGGSLSTGSVAVTAELGPGSHVVVATYAGDGVYAPASASLTESVTSPVGTITLTANPASPVFGQPVTLTVGPGGSAQFSDGGVPLGTGDGAITVSRLTAGTHTITATSGTASAELLLTVAKARTTTTVRISGGQAAAQVAAEAPGSGTPAGPVRFADGATGAAFAVVPLESGTASAVLPAGVSLATASYEGDANFSASASGAAGTLLVVNGASYGGVGFAAGEIVTVFGSNLSGAVRVTDSAGVARGADVLYASAAQMSVVLPEGMAVGAGTLTIGGMSAALPVARTAPGLFTVDASGKGVPVAQVVVVHADGTQDAGATDAIDAAGPGEAVYLVLYGTGVRHFAEAVQCTVAGVPARVVFAGPQGSAGLDQVNVLLPPELKGAGRVELVVTADGVASNAVTLVFR